MKTSKQKSLENGDSVVETKSKGGSRANNFQKDFERGAAGEEIVNTLGRQLGFEAIRTNDKTRDDNEWWMPGIEKTEKGGTNYIGVEVKSQFKYGCEEVYVRGSTETFVDDQGIKRLRVLEYTETVPATGNIFLETNGKQGQDKGLYDAVASKTDYFVNYLPGVDII
ncbi:MAG: hypothetical protein EOP10_31230, partial [Proteobacteria bacterium]